MLESVTVEGFQAHDKLKLTFGPGLNVISGASDRGKSAIMRAIRWALQNRPRGDYFVREGTGRCMVRLQLDGRTLTRRRLGSKNAYRLDEERFDAFGADPPAPVAQLAQVADINFQGQHDPPFWLGLSPGEIAKQLNEEVDLGVIDSCLDWLGKEVRRQTANVGYAEARLAEANQAAEAGAWAEAADKALQRVERLAKTAADYRAAETRLSGLLGTLEEAFRTAGRATRLLDHAQAALQAGQAWQQTQGEAEAVDRLLYRLGAAQHIASAPVPDVSRLEALRDKLRDAQRQAAAVVGLVAQLTAGQAASEAAAAALAKVEADLKEFKLCPKCNRPLPSPGPSQS